MRNITVFHLLIDWIAKFLLAAHSKYIATDGYLVPTKKTTAPLEMLGSGPHLAVLAVNVLFTGK